MIEADNTSCSTPSAIDRAFEGKDILVTGVTGFLGKVWVAMLLDRVQASVRISVLVRGGGGADAFTRFEAIANRSPALRPLREKYGAGFGAFLAERVRVVDGDVARPSFGLNEEAARKLAREIDLVVHFAGLTDFDPDPLDAVAANTRGALHVADFAAGTRGARLVHVSTAFVAGEVSGEIAETLDLTHGPTGVSFDAAEELRALEEACSASDRALGGAETREAKRARRELAKARARALGWPNTYTYTKGLAERLVASRTGLSLSIVRPSIVECATDFPLSGWNEGINTSGPLFWLLSGFFRGLPARPTHHFDVVPVDAVARGMIVIAAGMLRGEARGVYHLASSDVNPLSFERGIELTALSIRRENGKAGASLLDRFLLRHLDAVPAREGSAEISSLRAVRGIAKGVKTGISRVTFEAWLPPVLEARVGATIRGGLSAIGDVAHRVSSGLGRIDRMLELYKPFIYDNDYVFGTERVRELCAGLGASDRERFAFDVSKLDWRAYWLEVQGPGLYTWCFPLLRGEEAPLDLMPDEPVTLPRPRAPRVRARAHERAEAQGEERAS